MVKRKYSLNENYFETMNSPDKWYWIGFIMADGWIRPNKGELGIRLMKSDKKHLEKFRNSINSNHKIIFNKENSKNGYKNSGSYSINIYSKKIVNDLLRIGVVPNKSLINSMIDMPEEYEKDFWRGMIDGDGTLCTKIRKCNEHEKEIKILQIVGTENICNAFKNFCLKYINNKVSVFQKSEYCFRYQITAMGQPEKIVYILYNGSNLWLDRKYSIAEEWFNK